MTSDVPGDETPGMPLAWPRAVMTVSILLVLVFSAVELSTMSLYPEAKRSLSSVVGGFPQGVEGDLPLIALVLLVFLLAMARDRLLVVPLIASWALQSPSILSFSQIDWSRAVLPSGIGQYLASTLPLWAMVAMVFALAMVSILHRSYQQTIKVRTMLEGRNVPLPEVERATSSMFGSMGLLIISAAAVAALVGSAAFLLSPEIVNLSPDARILAMALVLICLGTYGTLVLFERYGGWGAKGPSERP